MKSGCCNNGTHNPVASFAEAWIEITLHISKILTFLVASFAEAWIEIITIVTPDKYGTGRLLRGGVD